MDSTEGGPVPAPLSPEACSVFAEGISLLLSRWSSLQLAIQNEWGGRNSRQKSDQLATDLISWFSQSKDRSKEPLYIDDLEEKLDKTMVLSFNMELDDGSIEEVAEQLMIMHEGCLQGHYESVEKLRKSSSGAESVSQSRRIVNDDDDDESSDDESSDMVMDELKPRLNPKPEPMSVDVQRPRETVEAEDGETVEAEDGWTVVGPKRNNGKRN